MINFLKNGLFQHGGKCGGTKLWDIADVIINWATHTRKQLSKST